MAWESSIFLSPGRSPTVHAATRNAGGQEGLTHVSQLHLSLFQGKTAAIDTSIFLCGPGRALTPQISMCSSHPRLWPHPSMWGTGPMMHLDTRSLSPLSGLHVGVHGCLWVFMGGATGLRKCTVRKGRQMIAVFPPEREGGGSPPGDGVRDVVAAWRDGLTIVCHVVSTVVLEAAQQDARRQTQRTTDRKEQKKNQTGRKDGEHR